jgi:excisionase family DNA binding protein
LCYVDGVNVISQRPFTVAEAAVRLKISERRVRELLEAGALTGERVGGIWLIERASVARRAAVPTERGRQLTARSVWAALSVLDPEIVAPKIDRYEKARARRRAEEIRRSGVEPGRFAARASLLRLHGHPGVLEQLLADPRVVRGGISAASEHKASLIGQGEADLYVRAESESDVVSYYGLQVAHDQSANVRFFVPATVSWPFREAARVVPAIVCAIDLIDAGDQRSLRAGRELLARVAGRL